MTRFTKALLNKPLKELTDDELRAIGKHLAKYPLKPVVKLHKCIACKRLVWFDALGEQLFMCLDKPVNDLATEGHLLMNIRKIQHWRKCDRWYDNNLPWPEEKI